MIAGLCGSAAHTALMYFKTRSGILPTFQPYPALQLALAKLTGTDVHPFVPWLLSWINGAAVLGFLFGRIYAFIPGRSGAAKGVVFGLFGWLLMGFAFFPLIGLGVFAIERGPGCLACAVSARHVHDLQRRARRGVRRAQSAEPERATAAIVRRHRTIDLAQGTRAGPHRQCNTCASGRPASLPSSRRHLDCGP